MKSISRPTVLLCAAAAIWVGLLFSTHADYAVTWDEPDWFQFGEAQRAWLSGSAPIEALDDPRNFFYYGTLPSLVAATGRWLLHDVLALLPEDQAWHAANVGFSLVLGTGIVFWAYRTIGSRGALWAILLWCAWPRLWPDWHNNISDLPGAALSLWAAWAAWRCAEDESGGWWNYARLGVLLGLAFSCRAPNVYFLVVLIGIWLGWLRLSGRPWPRRALAGVALAFLAFVLTVKAANPPFWYRSVLQQVLYLNPEAYLRGAMGRDEIWFNGRFYTGEAVPRTYAPFVFLLSTPLFLLVLLSSAVVRAVRSGPAAPSFVSLWLILGLGAIGKHLLGLGNYDGVRHFLEAYAPLTLATAWGVEQWWANQSKRGWGRMAILTGVLTMAAMVPPLVKAVEIHPYQTGYFNVLAGSTESAWGRFEFDYWGQSMMEASDWLERQDGERPARVYIPFEEKLLMRNLPTNFQVIAITREQPLSASMPDDWLVLPNRKGKLVSRRVDFLCPPGWQMVHETRISATLPPSARICRR